MSTSGCFGTCPIYSVTIHWNDSIYFHRTKSWINFSDTGHGVFDTSYTITANALATIDERLKKINFFALDSLYTRFITDDETVYFDFTSGNEHHKVANYAATNPDLDSLRNLIDSLVHSDEILAH